MSESEPTIRGVFVNSHITAVRRQLGNRGVAQLKERCGDELSFGMLEWVPVGTEVMIIEHALDLLHDDAALFKTRHFEAGRLHFKNFTTTPFGKFILFSVRDPKRIFMHAGKIASYVFRGIAFNAHDEGPTRLKLVMTGGIYHPDHFRGLFSEWIAMLGFSPQVSVHEVTSTHYEYTIAWSAEQVHGKGNAHNASHTALK